MVKCADLDLVDQVADGEGVFLVGAEDDRFLILVDRFHKKLDTIAFAVFDFDDAVEVSFGVGFGVVNRAFDDFIIGAVGIFVEGSGDLADFEGGEVAVVDAGFEGVGVDGIAEVGVGVSVVVAFGGGGEAELDGGGEVFKDAAPGAMALCW
jgi:hypothetical protein